MNVKPDHGAAGKAVRGLKPESQGRKGLDGSGKEAKPATFAVTLLGSVGIASVLMNFCIGDLGRARRPVVNLLALALSTAIAKWAATPRRA